MQHHLATLRARDTPSPVFRQALHRLTTLLAYEATRDMPLDSCAVDTPLESTQASRVAQRIGLVPILRAGLGMVDPILHLMPECEVWHLGLYRDEATLQPVEYYQKLPVARPVERALLVDPMLATGGSACAAIEVLKRWRAPQIRMLVIIAAPEGIEQLQSTYPDVDLFVCAIDRQLNDKGYILPGLGDAGDRYFNATAE